MTDLKEKFCEVLRSTNREGVEMVISNLDNLGFFTAPASTVFHLNREGGLVEHSLNVCEMALMLRETMIRKDTDLATKLPEDSVKIVSLLHDVCKAEIYRLGYRNVKKEQTGEWEKVPRYDVDYSNYPLGHGEKSVIRLLSWGFKLSLDETIAIRWHMSAWDLPFQSSEMKGNMSAARERTPLLTILQCADGLASGILEAKKDTDGKDSIYQKRIETVGLPLRASNVLRLNNITTVGEMIQHSREQLLHMHGFGKGCIDAIEAFMTDNGLNWE